MPHLSGINQVFQATDDPKKDFCIYLGYLIVRSNIETLIFSDHLIACVTWVLKIQQDYRSFLEREDGWYGELCIDAKSKHETSRHYIWAKNKQTIKRC